MKLYFLALSSAWVIALACCSLAEAQDVCTGDPFVRSPDSIIHKRQPAYFVWAKSDSGKRHKDIVEHVGQMNMGAITEFHKLLLTGCAQASGVVTNPEIEADPSMSEKDCEKLGKRAAKDEAAAKVDRDVSEQITKTKDKMHPVYNYYVVSGANVFNEWIPQDVAEKKLRTDVVNQYVGMWDPNKTSSALTQEFFDFLNLKIAGVNKLANQIDSDGNLAKLKMQQLGCSN